jgi:thioredoxin-related protein
MDSKLSKTLENLTSVAIIAVSVLLGIVLIKKFLLPRPIENPPAIQAQRDLQIPPGTTISLPNTDWSRNSRTLILAVSTTCHYCTESAEFYKAIVAQKVKKNSINIIAVLPQTQEQGKVYLEKLGVSVDEIKQAPLASIGVAATPTLLIIDQRGTVVESWVGKLPSDKEKEVLSRL